jgi:hypothetical protein
MTGLSAAEAVAAAPGPQRRRRTPWVIAVVVAVVLTLAIWIAWTVTVGRTADLVDADWSLDCSGTTVGTYQQEPAIRSRPGWRCDVALTVYNDSDRAVRVRRMVSPLLGSAGGAEIQGFATDDAEFSDGDDADGVWTVDVEIPAHGSRTINLAIGWRQEGCNAGGHLWIGHWPTIELETLHRTFEYTPDRRLVLRTFDEPHEETRCMNR